MIINVRILYGVQFGSSHLIFYSSTLWWLQKLSNKYGNNNVCMSPSILFFSFKITLAFLNPFLFPCEFEDQLLHFCRKDIWHFDKNGTEFVDQFGEYNYINFSKYDLEICFNLFGSSFMFSINYYLVFKVQNYNSFVKCNP